MLISIIIVNWNGKHLIDECLNALYKQIFRDFEIIVVDNGSNDGSQTFIKEKHPLVKLIELSENKGFTGGNNEGFKYAKGDFIALLNNDAIPCEKWLVSLLAPMLENKNIGICASKLVVYGTNIIDSAGDGFTTAGTGYKIGEGEDESKYNTPCFTSGACAGAALYRKEMIDDIGFLDDDFFLNHEDTDLTFRAILAGWKCYFVPEAVVYHKVNATIGHLSDTSVYYSTRNNEFVYIKNMPFKLMMKYVHHRIIYEIAAFMYSFVVSGKWIPFTKGKIDAIKMLPKMIKKRKAILKNIKINIDELESQMMPTYKFLGKIGFKKSMAIFRWKD